MNAVTNVTAVIIYESHQHRSPCESQAYILVKEQIRKQPMSMTKNNSINSYVVCRHSYKKNCKSVEVDVNDAYVDFCK